MSTRCQVRVIQEEQGWDASITLYHHSDGYPEHIIPDIVEAYAKFGEHRGAGRAGHVAAFLCAVDPTSFEPEEGHELHGDIEYYYTLWVGRGQWEVEIRQPNNSFDESSVMKNLKIVQKRTLLGLLAEKYPSS